MLLIDAMHAVHCGLAPNYSTCELSINLPSSNHQFRAIYSSLTHGFAIPQDVRTREDGLLLLVALLQDVLYLQRRHHAVPLPSRDDFGTATGQASSNDPALRNPFASLSAQSEFLRMTDDLLAALSRWEQHFHRPVGSDILALYYFTRLHLICPDIWLLPHLANYEPTRGFSPARTLSSQHADRVNIPDRAMDLAWLVLDHCDKASKSVECRLSVWLPIVLLLSALVIWQKLRSQPDSNRKYGTLRVLSMFRDEIVKLPWPCCEQMTSTLERLMEK